MLIADLQCKCCGKTHAPKKTNNDAEKCESKAGGSGEGGKGGNDGKPHSYSTSPPVEWTPEDDAKIMEMKSRKQVPDWKDIAAACGGKGSKSQINDRYRELKDHPVPTAAAKTDEERKKVDGEQKKAENPAKAEDEGKGGKKKKGKGKGQVDEQKVSEIL